MEGFPSCVNLNLKYSSTSPCNGLLIAPDSAHSLEYLEPSCIWKILYIPTHLLRMSFPNILSPTSSLFISFLLYFPASDLAFPGKPRVNIVFPSLALFFDFLGGGGVGLTSYKFSGLLRSYQLHPGCQPLLVECKHQEGGAPSILFITVSQGLHGKA